MRVLAALSGGVDSAVAAARVVAAGHDVTGVHLALSANPQTFRDGARGCCSLEDSRDARRAADVLGIPFYVWDMAEEFRLGVMEDFIAEYEAGRTPNPCLRCNEKIKFSALLDRAIALGFDAVATGHYAKIVDGKNGAELHRAIDPLKDQSYVLGVLEQWQLSKAMFPVGDTHKPEIRLEAEKMDLLVAQKPDSHDICFIPDGDTAGFLTNKIGTRAGDIVEITTDEVVGRHSGSHTFTIGQRRGLHLGRPAADGQPRYVVKIDASENRVYVGPIEYLAVNTLHGIRSTWPNGEVESGTRVGMQWRAHGTEVPAEVTFTETGVSVRVDEPIKGVAAGQQAVFYLGSQVIGSMIIESSELVA
jgi:tRNA-specific 2-thiouridylase